MIILAGAALARIQDWLQAAMNCAPTATARRGPTFPLSSFLFSRLAPTALVTIFLLSSLAWNFSWWLKWFSHPRYEMTEAGAKLNQALGQKPAVVIGKWAGPLLFQSRHQYYYVKNIFNRHPEQLKSFGITHLLLGEVPVLVREFELREDPYTKSFQAAFPSAFEQKNLAAEIKFYQSTLFLYQIETK